MAKSYRFAVCANLITGRSIYSKHRSRDAAEKALAKARKNGACFCIVQMN
jgi:hypothetical protein